MEGSESSGSGSTQKTGGEVLQQTGAVNTMETKQKTDATYRHYFRLLQGKQKSAIIEYDFERDGTLVTPRLTDNYELVDQYWIEKGRSLVIIALNRRTNQKEYLLFEPTLSDFEYELLERLYEDLRVGSGDDTWSATFRYADADMPALTTTQGARPRRRQAIRPA